MYSSVLTGCISGVDAALVHAEVDISTGLPGFSLVGSLGCEVKEAKERVQVALKNSGFHLPPNKITINLSPANIRKEGTGFDVPIAIGLLQALGYFTDIQTENMLFVGELGLNGEVKSVKGILPIVRMAAKAGVGCCFVPYENRMEGSMVTGIDIRGVSHISELVSFLRQKSMKEKDIILPICKTSFVDVLNSQSNQKILDFSQVKGQRVAKRAAEIAAAGFHNMIMCGPPGGGKSMIAKRIPSILPEMTEEECLEVSSIYSVAGKLSSDQPLVLKRPFISPHHTTTYSALVGGGTKGKPGAVSLAHRGVLFLDELTEFPRPVLECLRQPLEDRQIVLSRNYGTYTYPADFMLICAMNPCKCGYYPDRNKCTCSAGELQQYRNKISGPLLDRIDLYVETSPIDIFDLKEKGKEESTQKIKERVMRARSRQKERFIYSTYSFNGEMSDKDIEKFCVLGTEQQKLVEAAYKKMGMSARSYQKVLKVARTIADLAGEDRIGVDHLSEALSYRLAERKA